MEKRDKESPIAFTTDMVSAILNGCKIQTRKVVKPQPVTNGYEWFWNEITVKNKVGALGCFPKLDEFLVAIRKFCPYGKPGDRLWVKETFAFNYFRGSAGMMGNKDFQYQPTDIDKINPGFYQYRADEPYPEYTGGWNPCNRMPRIASRILLEITAVRCERLLSISNTDAIAEGVKKFHIPELELGGEDLGLWKNYLYTDKNRDTQAKAKTTPMDSFHTLWASMNGLSDLSTNPWVWVIEFKRI